MFEHITTAGSGPRDPVLLAYHASGARPLLRIVGPGTPMTCDRCGKSARGVGYVMHSRHRDDPQDYQHVLCHECNPAYEVERNCWQEDHPLPSVEGMTKQDRHTAIQKWAKVSHEHMRDWLVAERQR